MPLASIVATDILLLLQLPPGTASLNTVLPAKHRLDAPVIAAGKGLTVTLPVTWHVVGSAYVITVLPTLAPVTSPVALTAATAGLPDVQAPPGVESLSTVTEPTQTPRLPDMGIGNGLTVTACTTAQPLGRLYEIVVLPAATPVTAPVAASMVAALILLLLHVPAEVVLPNVITEPAAQTDAGPVIAAGYGFNVSGAVVKHPGGMV